MKPRVLVTGAAGGVGRLVRDLLGDRFEFVCLDRVPTPGVPGAVVADLTDAASLDRAVAGCEAVVHLGAHPNPAPFLEVILPSNVVGTYRVFEAAVRAGVKRVVLASTMQVEMAHPRDLRVSVEMAPVATNMYAASKVFGECLGHLYHRRHGLEVVCLRFGHVAAPSRLPEMLARGHFPNWSTLTARDCAEIVARSLTRPGIGFVVLPAYSRNAAARIDFAPLKRVLDYEPVDDAFEVWPAPARGRPVWRRLLSRYWRLRWKLRQRAWYAGGGLRRALAAGRPIHRVLMTGAAGYVGSALRARLSERYDFVCFDRRPIPGAQEAVIGDLNARAALARAARGCDAVIHLGGVRDEADFMTEILPNNVTGTWHALREAAAAGVRRFVFASTVQAEDGYPRDGRRVSVGMPPLPTTYYAAAKVLGEDLGRSMARHTSMSVVALRLGWVRAPGDPEWKELEGRPPPRITLTVNDLAAIVTRALEAPVDWFALLPAYSRSAAAVKDLAPLKDVLGVEPQDDPVAEFERAETV